jgi:acetyl esterase/lipase
MCSRRNVFGLALVALLTLVPAGGRPAQAACTGCNCPLPDKTPPGAAPLRYRDLVFPNVTTITDVTYTTAVNQQGQPVTLMLDVYQPTGDTITSRPAIVWVHGGSFAFGSKTSAELIDEATTFAGKGYVNVSINYRLSPNGCTGSGTVSECVTAIVDAMHDTQTAVRFLRANAAVYGVDTSRIACGGTSAGAITALNVGYNPNDVGTNPDYPGFSSAVGGAVSLSGAEILGTPNAGDAPALLFHGTNDTLVPYQWAVTTVNNALAAGLDAFLTTWQGAGHVPYLQNRTQILEQTTNFLYWELDLQHAAQ